MLEKDLCLELSLLGDNLTAVTSYAAAAERLQLQKVRQGLVECCGTASGWKRLQEQKQVCGEPAVHTHRLNNVWRFDFGSVFPPIRLMWYVVAFPF